MMLIAPSPELRHYSTSSTIGSPAIPNPALAGPAAQAASPKIKWRDPRIDSPFGRVAPSEAQRQRGAGRGQKTAMTPHTPRTVDWSAGLDESLQTATTYSTDPAPLKFYDAQLEIARALHELRDFHFGV